MNLDYKPLKNLPPLAGLCSFDEAMKPGLPVQVVVNRLKRYHFTLRRLWKILNARLAAEPIYELKMAFSLHEHLIAEHTSAMRDRVAEMRHPPLGLDKIPDDNLATFFDEIQSAPNTHALLAGIYGKAIPSLVAAFDRHLEETNRLADAPTVRVLRFAKLEMVDLIEWGQTAVACLESEAAPETEVWLGELDAWLVAAGDLDGSAAAGKPPAPRYSAKPFEYPRTPVRDERFPDPFNMGVHAEEFLYDESFPDREKTLMMYFKRLREIDVPEMMASILYEIEGKPWGFYREMTRQLWDEARHAMMGEVGFLSIGIDWPKFVRLNHTWAKGLNEQLTPKERHAVLWFIEQGLMHKTGKRFEWEVGERSGDPLSVLFQDYDWADEVLHARIGRDWYVSEFDDDVAAAKEYGSSCWSKVVSGWEDWKRDGLTEHENWWPNLYREWCRVRGEEPKKEILAYDKTYAETRADLKRIAASA
ncbi:MAG: hypothetical protein ACI8UO_002000 [Verrucomicrobiales bacterium]|jgi:hypothetical protein